MLEDDLQIAHAVAPPSFIRTASLSCLTYLRSLRSYTHFQISLFHLDDIARICYYLHFIHFKKSRRFQISSHRMHLSVTAFAFLAYASLISAQCQQAANTAAGATPGYQGITSPNTTAPVTAGSDALIQWQVCYAPCSPSHAAANP